MTFARMARADANGSASELSSAIQAILDRHTGSQYPGEFRVVKTAIGYSIVPTGVRGRGGVATESRSPLDSPVYFSDAQRNAADALKVLCDAVSGASGRRVEPGVVEGLDNQVVQLGANGESARDILIRLVKGQVLGYALFERKTRTVALTPAGVAFVAEARRALMHAQRAIEAGLAASVGETNVIRVRRSNAHPVSRC